MKYVHYKNPGGCGFGNQLRSFAGAYTLAQFTGRQLIVTDQYLINAFECPYGDWDQGVDISGLSKRPFAPSVSNSATTRLIPIAMTEDLNQFSEDVLMCGDGTDMGGMYLQENPHYADQYNEILDSVNGTNYYDYLVGSWGPILRTPSKKYEDIAKKIIDYDKHDYINIQFRSFYDADNKYLGLLDGFIEKFKEVVEEKGLQNKRIFLTTDNARVSGVIKDRLQSFDIFESCYPMIHSQNYNLESISDWLIIGNSSFSFNTGTSFATTAGIIHGTDMYIHGEETRGYIGDVLTQII